MTESKTIGIEIAALCREGKSLGAVQSFYADDVVSVEAMEGGGPRIVNGRDAVLEKNRRWSDMMEVHAFSTTGPFPHGENRFALFFSWDGTHRASGARQKLEDVAIYTVSDGKVVREEFFYDA